MKYVPKQRPQTSNPNDTIDKSAQNQNTDTTYYDSIRNKTKKYYKTPTYVNNPPSKKDFEKGYYTRYFLKRVNDINSAVIEVDNTQFDGLGSNIDGNLYYGIKLDWKITGMLDDHYTNNSIDSYGVRSTNDRTITINEQKIPGLISILKNSMEYWRN